MIRLNLIVEGHAEETFVRDVLAPHLAGFEVWAGARRVETGRRRGRVFRGGMTSYEKARGDIRRWLAQERSADARFSTMFDLYRLPKGFPGFEEAARKRDPYEKVKALERRLRQDVDDRRFLPYIQLHEFEALLFADIGKLAHRFPDHESAIEALVDTAARYEGPEWIDDGAETAPSKRIGARVPPYLSAKATAGPQVAADIGLPAIREQCPHFDRWVSDLEKLA